ncbi:MAG: ATP-grasp domain-containing protein [Mangrovibacterium sp.]
MNSLAIILYNRLEPHAAPDERDVLDQAEFVKAALTGLGYACQVREVGTDLYDDLRRVKELSPGFVFNLVESVFGRSELLHLVPSILASWQILYTGVSDEGLFLTTRKPLAKRIMLQHGIATPCWFSPGEAACRLDAAKKYILKPGAEEGSVKLDEDAVFLGNDPEMLAILPELSPDAYFVEEFLGGREFNLSVVGKPGNYRILPVAEMIYDRFPPGKEQVLGYRAKWEEQSFEYRHTSRQFNTLKNEPELEKKLIHLAGQCGDVFRLSGYFRVDFRLSEAGEPSVLEINGNPCISPDSGFVAALLAGGLSIPEGIREIIACLPLNNPAE